MEKYNTRLNKLNSNINEILQLITRDSNTKFTDQFSENDYLKLKNVLSDIHNVLTLKLSFKFIEQLSRVGLNENQIISEKQKIDKISPNAKGFDIRIDEPIKILAEVKCIIPDKKRRFNAVQRKNLFLDAVKLKQKDIGINNNDYFKFLIIQDNGTETDEAITSFLNYNPIKLNTERESRKKILEDLILLDELNNIKILDKLKVYIIKI